VAFLQLNFEVEKDIEVTQLVWLDKHVKNLLQHEYIKKEILLDYPLKYFSWDGR
jgi:hypothetical protein